MRTLLLACWILFAFVSCRKAPSDPPPPREKFEVPVAPPNALGAQAAGTDAAPRVQTEPAPWGAEEEEELPEELLPDTDSGTAVPDAGGIPL